MVLITVFWIRKETAHRLCAPQSDQWKYCPARTLRSPSQNLLYKPEHFQPQNLWWPLLLHLCSYFVELIANHYKKLKRDWVDS